LKDGGAGKFNSYANSNGEVEKSELRRARHDFGMFSGGKLVAESEGGQKKRFEKQWQRSADRLLKEASWVQRNHRLSMEELRHFGNVLANPREKWFVSWLLETRAYNTRINSGNSSKNSSKNSSSSSDGGGSSGGGNDEQSNGTRYSQFDWSGDNEVVRAPFFFFFSYLNASASFCFVFPALSFSFELPSFRSPPNIQPTLLSLFFFNNTHIHPHKHHPHCFIQLDIFELRAAIKVWAKHAKHETNRMFHQRKALLRKKSQLADERKEMLAEADQRAAELMEVVGW
jgi:hypothetical protein